MSAIWNDIRIRLVFIFPVLVKFPMPGNSGSWIHQDINVVINMFRVEFLGNVVVVFSVNNA